MESVWRSLLFSLLVEIDEEHIATAWLEDERSDLQDPQEDDWSTGRYVSVSLFKSFRKLEKSTTWWDGEHATLHIGPITLSWGP